MLYVGIVFFGIEVIEVRFIVRLKRLLRRNIDKEGFFLGNIFRG